MKQEARVNGKNKGRKMKLALRRKKITSFTLAVNREFKNGDGNYDADFIPCVAWRNAAELLDTDKGHQIG